MSTPQNSAEQAKITSADLLQFRGSETFTRHWSGLTYTEGVNYLAEKADCYWLIDAIASYQPQCRQDHGLRDFQLWVLIRQGQELMPWLAILNPNSAILTCWRDSPRQDAQPMIRQDIEFTNFPLNEIRLYVCNGVLLLPSEY